VITLSLTCFRCNEAILTAMSLQEDFVYERVCRDFLHQIPACSGELRWLQ
jgi:hypothetical protein